MDYKIGDIVVHWTHGLGKVIAIEEMQLSGGRQEYYVVEVGLLKLWVPTDEANEGSLRFPLEGDEFKQLLNSLQTPGEKLPENYTKRKVELRERIEKRTLKGLCLLIRDLTDHSNHHTLNLNDSAVLFRAEAYLLDEWVLSLGVEREEAQSELNLFLRSEQPGICG